MKIIAYAHEKRLIDIIYKPKIRAENETRTRDPNLGKVVLYQLSYFRIFYERFSSRCVGDSNP